MRGCRQFHAQDVLEHGLAVAETFGTLRRALETGASPQGWRLPAWLMAEPVRQDFLARCLPWETLYWYQRYHDCGKPFCREVDAEGRTHFPNHAAVSEGIWTECGGAPEIGRLIGLDMAIHTASAQEMAALSTLPEAPSLFLTALAEIHSNAPMFGGFESVSFKAKAKHLDRRGKQLLSE
ncbi:hypothetical protein G3A43_06160 [Paraburkholderia aspalathi]|nr:hypothetical protein [Paraburkholderia aspalathi]MBK3779831.1 hypothetical protein [Paraburkholderia aspalathi]